MKNIYNYTKKLVLITLMLTTLGSCKKSFLEILPKGRIIASKTTDYDLMLNNLDLINSNGDGQVVLGDEIAAVEPAWSTATNKDRQLFKYEADLYAADEDSKETLVPLKALYIYNKIINEVPESTGGSEAAKNSIQAEALCGRAWTYFFLINYFGKPYNAATAGTDLGFPMITEADVTQTSFERVSVQQIYDLMISDLTKAIPNLTNTGVVWRGRMSKSAAKGILAKVYISMGRFAEALPLLNESISEVNGPGAAVTVALYNYNTALPGFPTTVNDTENLYSKSVGNGVVSTANRLYWLTPEAAALYDVDDKRLATNYYANMVFPNGLRLIRRTGTAVTHFGVRLADLYLMRAEVKARLNDLTGAVTDVQFLRQHRLPAAKVAVPTASAGDRVALIRFILDERIREFAAQGYRWYDMRRLSVDPLFTTPTYQHKVYNAAGVVSETYTLKPDRFVFKFSPKIMGENPALVNNP